MQQYQQLPARERGFADKCFSDIESDKAISTKSADLAPPLPDALPISVFDAFMLYGANARNADISNFLIAFDNPNHAVGNFVSVKVDKAKAAYSAEAFKKVLAAIF